MRKIILIFFVVAILSLVVYYFYPENKLPTNSKVTKIVVIKSKRQMLVYDNDKLLKTYKVSLGHNPIGDKVYEGDNKTPEGNYFIDSKNPNSTCYKNLGISYPDKSHIDFAKNIGKTAGGDIKIHGLPNKQPFWGKFHRLKNWTNGCVGVTNEEIDELYNAVSIGTPIIIKP